MTKRNKAGATNTKAGVKKRTKPKQKTQATKTQRGTFSKFIFRFTVLCFAFIFAIFSGYLIYLDDQITGTFKGRLWSIPARVYAQPLELYAGAQIQADELALELGRLGYLRGVPTHPGSYSRAFTAEGQKFDIHLRAFQFADGYREAINISLLISSAQIKSLHAAANNTNTALIRLEAPVIGSIFPSHGEDRIILAPADVPELLTQSLIAVEDHNFLTHKGFDPVGILRAAWVNLRAGEIKQGGSTLTQQLVKSYFLNNQRTLSRKLKELLMAIILDARFTKEALLNAYINEIYIGQDGSRAVHGFGLGAQYYFNKPVSELAPHEVALLITIIRGPSYYNPRRNPSRALERRNRVLGQMLEAGIIAPAVHNQSVRKALNKTSIARKGGGYYPAFMDLVRQKLSLEYDLKTLSSHGYKIFTTLDPRVQEAAQQAVEKTLSALEQRRQLPPGELQAALVVSNTQTGELQAVVGGREAGFQGFNRAINASRPIGSLIKPVVYLTALETQNFNLLSPLNDAPLPKLPDQAKHWSPQNFDGRVNGQVPLVRAMADSLNLATAHLGLKLGVQEVGSRFAQLTQQKTKKRYPSFMLGAVEMSPMQVSELYSVFASGGFHSPLRTVTEVIDETGKPLKRYALKIQQLVAADNIIQLNTLLKIVMTHGTGKSSKFRNAGIAGKTGTSDQSRDSWFVSFDDKRLSTVWIGYDDNRASKLTGSSGALKVWDAFATKVKVSSLGIPASFSLETVTVDYQSGLRAEQSCSDQIIIVPVPKGTYIYPHPGCTKTLQDLSNRVKQWFQK